MAGERLVGGAAMFGGNDRANAMLFASKSVVGFEIVAGVSRQLGEPHDAQRLGHQRTELVDVGQRSTQSISLFASPCLRLRAFGARRVISQFPLPAFRLQAVAVSTRTA